MKNTRTAAATTAATTSTMMTMSSAGLSPLRGGPPAEAISAPQPEQNRASSSLARPQDGQLLAIVPLQVR